MVGIIGELVSGSGANAKTLLDKSAYVKEVLKTAVSHKKVAMYTEKLTAIKKSILVATVRFSASIFASDWTNKGLGKLFCWLVLWISLG